MHSTSVIRKEGANSDSRSKQPRRKAREEPSLPCVHAKRAKSRHPSGILIEDGGAATTRCNNITARPAHAHMKISVHFGPRLLLCTASGTQVRKSSAKGRGFHRCIYVVATRTMSKFSCISRARSAQFPGKIPRGYTPFEDMKSNVVHTRSE